VRLEPVERHGLQIMSVGFLLGERQALTLGAPLLAAALTQLVEHVEWRGLDVLLIDLPPGTADLQQQLLGGSHCTTVSAVNGGRRTCRALSRLVSGRGKWQGHR